VALECHSSSETARPPLEVAGIFRIFGDAYRRTHLLSREQSKVMRDIEECRTDALGGHLDDVCDRCGYRRPSYNSCRNRHCPKCQGLAQAIWLEQRKQRLLPTHYFHVVFTLCSELRPLALANPELIFNLLFAGASETLLCLGRDIKRLGATLGLTAVLHTWTRDLRFHPHVHIIVTGGGLALDERAWINVKGGRYLFPVEVLSALFRGKFLDKLDHAYKQGALRLNGPAAHLADPAAWARLRHHLYRKEWVVYAKRPFGGVEQVFSYLGRYTHRVGISNQRLESIDETGIRFRTKNGKTATLSPDEFIGRFLLHVLPKSFVKIRHYGLLASTNVRTKLEVARKLLGVAAPITTVPPDTSPEDPRATILRLTGIDLFHCPRCKVGNMIRDPFPPSALPARSPPDLTP
jgi:Putative transposase/Transposase zinc-binding domain